MDDILNVPLTVLSAVTFLLVFFIAKLEASRREVALIVEHNAVKQRLIEQQFYMEGQLRNIERLVSMQEDMLEMRHNYNKHILDLLLLSLEGEDLKPYLNIVLEAEQLDEE